MKDKVNEITEKVVNLLIAELDPEKVILFGSRAKGNAKPYSDIDIAVEGGKPIDHRERRKLKEKIEQLSGIYTVDIIFLDRVEKDFAELVKNTGRVLYEKRGGFKSLREGTESL